MSTKEKATTLFNLLTENDLELFISLFGRLYDVKPSEEDNDETESRKIGKKKGSS